MTGAHSLLSLDSQVRTTRILLVDGGDPDEGAALAGHLAAQGFVVDRLAGGEPALAALARRPADLVLLGVATAEGSGLDALRALRLRHGATALPILAVTAAEDIAEALAAGANDCLVRPVDLDLAVARIASLADRQIALERLRRSEQRIELVLRGTNDGIWDWDLETGEILLSPRWYELAGLEPEAGPTEPETWFARVHPEDLPGLRTQIARHIDGVSLSLQAEYRLRHRNNAWRWMLLRGVAARDAQGRARRLAGSQSDITDRKLTDPVTGLSNRLLFLDRVGQALARCERRPEDGFAVAVLSLDRFTKVQETLGPTAADTLIATVARRLLAHVRPMDSVARVGGDKLAILLDRIADPEQAARIIERCRMQIAAPVPVGGNQVPATATVGLALREPGHADADAVLRDAYAALAAALAGGNVVALHDASTQQAIRHRLALEVSLKHALACDRLALLQQPIYELGSGRCVGFEGLLRWRQEDGRLVLPGEFIGMAEETGLIVELGAHAIGLACRQAALWQQTGLPEDVTLSVNVSPRQVARPDFAERVIEIAREHGVPPARLRLEITESALSSQVEGLERKLASLKAAGFTLSLDDFGTGYSALALLPRLPLDVIKIDRGFVHGMLDDPAHAKIVEAIVRLSYGLGLQVVAEGIETEAQAAALTALGCQYGQGFLMAAPMPPELAVRALDRRYEFARPVAAD